MTDQYLHGIEFIGIDTGPRVIETPRAGIIGIVGTAPAADITRLPVGKPVLLNSALKADVAAVGSTGTLATAMDIYSRTGNYYIVMIRVAEGTLPADTLANVVAGIQLLKGAESITKVKPRILLAPGFSHETAVGTELATVSEALRAYCYVDADADEAADYADAIDYRESFGSKRVNVIWPAVMVFNNNSKTYVETPASIVAAALEAGTNYWESTSNRVIPLVAGTSHPIHFELSNPNTTANLLNEKGVTTIVHQLGYRLWGSRNASDDSIWRYRHHVRLDDMLAEALVQAHLWAVDKNITKTYADSVVENAGSFLRRLQKLEVIAGGKCWFDPEVNTVDAMDAGLATFDFDYGRFGLAEHVAFRRRLNQGYVEEIF